MKNIDLIEKRKNKITKIRELANYIGLSEAATEIVIRDIKKLDDKEKDNDDTRSTVTH
jgi:hypothetical protein